LGAPAARITRSEFLTPPEFRDCLPTGHEAARVGGARIELIRDAGGVTRLGRCYQQIPVRLMPPFDLDGEPASLLYLITLTAGLMDGDGHLIELSARAGTCAVVTGQAATRVHPALASFSTQQWDVRLEDDAMIVVLPGPTIPFRGSRYYQRARVEMAPSSRLIWGDIWLAGRYERGELSERHVFERIVQDFELRRAGQLLYRDRFRWDGPWTPGDVDWFAGGALATGSLVVAGPMPEGFVTEMPGVRAAVLPLDTGATCLRWCGPPAAVATALVEAALTIAGSWTDGPGAPPWLLRSSELAPNHWFSTPPA
jgi:urease accessory protein